MCYNKAILFEPKSAELIISSWMHFFLNFTAQLDQICIFTKIIWKCMYLLIYTISSKLLNWRYRSRNFMPQWSSEGPHWTCDFCNLLLNHAAYDTKIGRIQFLWAGAKKYLFLPCAGPLSSQSLYCAKKYLFAPMIVKVLLYKVIIK